MRVLCSYCMCGSSRQNPSSAAKLHTERSVSLRYAACFLHFVSARLGAKGPRLVVAPVTEVPEYPHSDLNGTAT